MLQHSLLLVIVEVFDLNKFNICENRSFKKFTKSHMISKKTSAKGYTKKTCKMSGSKKSSANRFNRSKKFVESSAAGTKYFKLFVGQGAFTDDAPL